jgi:hypothetical protein
MKTINLKNTGEQIIYHDYFKPFICTADIDPPKMYNQGLNNFRFVEPVNFTGENMPEILVRETNNYLFYEADIQVIRKDKSTVSGFYYKTIDKTTGEAKETITFEN